MRKIKGLRWYMIALVTLGTVLGYLTRNTVAAAAPTLMEELHISTQQYSYIIAAYSAAYTVMQPVAGYVLDILGTKIGYAFFAVAWAIFCGATAMAGSWGGGAGAWCGRCSRSRNDPGRPESQLRVVPGERTFYAVGYFNVGSSIGAMIAPPLVVWAIVMHSWQMAFIISGVLSFAWAMAWLIFYKHPAIRKNCLLKNVTTSLAVRNLSTRPTTAKKCLSGRFWAPVSSGDRAATFPGRTSLGYV
jgi:ACS family hexuronate transporter-like MFS transporter